MPDSHIHIYFTFPSVPSGIKDAGIMSAVLIVDKAVAEGWNAAIIEAMVPAAKTVLGDLVPAAPSIADKLYAYFNETRWCPRFRVEFTKMGRWLFRLATGYGYMYAGLCLDWWHAHTLLLTYADADVRCFPR